MSAFNPDPALLTPSQMRTLALSVVFWAARLAYRFAATDAPLSDQERSALEILLNGALVPAPSPLAAYGRLETLIPAMTVLDQSLQARNALTSKSPRALAYRETVRYAFALAQIERLIYGRSKRANHFAEQLSAQQRRLAFFDQDVTQPAILAGLAQTYVDTASQLRLRLKVRGSQQALTQQANIDRIRACLLAGVQAAHLWHQLGGRRWHLMTHRKQFLNDLQHMTQHTVERRFRQHRPPTA